MAKTKVRNKKQGNNELFKVLTDSQKAANSSESEAKEKALPEFIKRIGEAYRGTLEDLYEEEENDERPEKKEDFDLPKEVKYEESRFNSDKSEAKDDESGAKDDESEAGSSAPEDPATPKLPEEETKQDNPSELKAEYAVETEQLKQLKALMESKALSVDTKKKPNVDEVVKAKLEQQAKSAGDDPIKTDEQGNVTEESQEHVHAPAIAIESVKTLDGVEIPMNEKVPAIALFPRELPEGTPYVEYILRIWTVAK